MKFRTVNELTAYLYHLPRLHEKSDLTYVKRVLKALGDPQDKVKCCHITGTNGKGSTAYYLSNLLQKAGQQTGLFVSPFIIRFNERIQLNGQAIADEDLLEVANEVEAAVGHLREEEADFALVTFEYEVAMAFLFFAKQKCDYAVIEVGIGAEHDKTNVMTPVVSLITTIGLDHEQIIGPTLADIAKEKSGIIKPAVPVILGDIPASVKGIVEEKITESASPSYWLGRDFQVKEEKAGYELAVAGQNYQLPAWPRPEAKDAAMALAAFALLPLALSEKAAEAALTQTTVPGRYQRLEKAGCSFLLDGAHNVQAESELLPYARRLAKDKGGRLLVLAGMMKDKDLSDFLTLLKDEKVTLTSLAYPRAAKKADFPAWVQEKFAYEGDLGQALKQVMAEAGDRDLILVTGSFYLVSAVLQLLQSA